MILSGTFEQIVALAAALFVMRRREPDLPRPYRAFGFPYTTGVVLAGSLLILVAAVVEDPRSGIAAALLLIACALVYAWLCRKRRLGDAKVLAEPP